MIYDMNTKSVIRPEQNLKDISITRFRPLNDKELLIATDGGGVHKIDVDTYQITPEIVADYNSNNGMNGNSINDIFVDDEERVWLANYPIGITIQNNRYTGYKWIKHSIGNKQSLINDRGERHYRRQRRRFMVRNEQWYQFPQFKDRTMAFGA